MLNIIFLIAHINFRFFVIFYSDLTIQQDELYAGLYDIHINTLPFYQMLLFNVDLRVLFRHTLPEHLFTLWKVLKWTL